MVAGADTSRTAQEIQFNGKPEFVLQAPYVVKSHAWDRADNHFIAARVEYADKGRQRSVVEVSYFKRKKAGEDALFQVKRPELTPDATTYEKNKQP